MKTSWEIYEALIESVDRTSREQYELAGNTEWSSLADNDPINPSTLEKRKAEKHFSGITVAREPFEALPGKVKAVDAVLWKEAARQSPLDLYMFASHVDGLEPGIYRLDGEEAVRATNAELGTAEDLVLQPEFASAAAIVFIVGSIKSVTEAQGDHGYRVLLERAGAAAETVWLESLEMGYSASIFAGILPSILRGAIGVDGFTKVQLLAVAVGRQPSPSL